MLSWDLHTNKTHIKHKTLCVCTLRLCVNSLLFLDPRFNPDLRLLSVWILTYSPCVLDSSVPNPADSIFSGSKLYLVVTKFVYMRVSVSVVPHMVKLTLTRLIELLLN